MIISDLANGIIWNCAESGLFQHDDGTHRVTVNITRPRPTAPHVIHVTAVRCSDGVSIPEMGLVYARLLVSFLEFQGLMP